MFFFCSNEYLKFHSTFTHQLCAPADRPDFVNFLLLSADAKQTEQNKNIKTAKKTVQFHSNRHRGRLISPLRQLNYVFKRWEGGVSSLGDFYSLFLKLTKKPLYATDPVPSNFGCLLVATFFFVFFRQCCYQKCKSAPEPRSVLLLNNIDSIKFADLLVCLLNDRTEAVKWEWNERNTWVFL